MGDMSELPEDIIHHILSFITISFMGTTKETARVSVFCKSWYNAWLTCPTLSFSIMDFSKVIDGSEKYSKFMERTLLRYKRKKIPIERLKLDLIISDYCSAAHVNEWIRVAIENGVKKIALVLGDIPMLGSNEYTLPRSMFEANSVRELSLRLYCRFRLEKQIDGKVMFNNLQTLKLHLMPGLDDDMFHYILARSPLIENLSVKDCGSLKRIKVSTLYRLERFYVACSKQLDLEIEAPNLQYLHCDLVRSLKLYNTEKLIHLALLGDINLSSTFLEHKFLQLETLNLSALKGVKRIDISSHSLKYLGLNAKELRKINIDAPNLVSLELYHINLFPNLSLGNTQSLKIFAYRCPKDEAKPTKSKISLELDEAVDEERFKFSWRLQMS